MKYYLTLDRVVVDLQSSGFPRVLVKQWEWSKERAVSSRTRPALLLCVCRHDCKRGCYMAAWWTNTSFNGRGASASDSLISFIKPALNLTNTELWYSRPDANRLDKHGPDAAFSSCLLCCRFILIMDEHNLWPHSRWASKLNFLDLLSVNVHYRGVQLSKHCNAFKVEKKQSPGWRKPVVVRVPHFNWVKRQLNTKIPFFSW